MSKRHLLFLLLIIVTFLTIAGIPTESKYFYKNEDTNKNLIAGRNINMVSGTQLPYGDPWLQRQNEPSIAVSTRNPLHLLGGANDYRTIDMPGELNGEVPGQEEKKTAQALGREPWLGVFKSFDGGQTWITTLLPGHPLDYSNEGLASPFKIGSWEAAADPVVRAGTNGIFYYSGIAFHRETREGVLFVSRFIDNNNREMNTKAGDCIKYLDTKIIAVGSNVIFIDKPWIAVDLPHGKGQKVTIDGQSISRHSVYIAFSEFTGEGATLESKICFAQSDDCGETWSNPIQLNEGHAANQGATIAVDPRGNGHICVAWRRFAKQKNMLGNSIFVARSVNGGKKFNKVIEVASFDPFDQGSSGVTFRTNSYPSLAIDDKGRIYLAWSKRMGGPSGDARIVLSTSNNGINWSVPRSIDDPGAQGHQVMPSLTFAAGKLMLAWYDQREDYSQRFTEYINDISGEKRHTLDVRVAEAEPGENPDFKPSIQVSRYRYVLSDDGTLQQAQFNPVNYPLFKGGTWPFIGDYIDIAPSPMFVLDNKSGQWRYNSEPSNSAVYHVAWTDNRDVRPPLDHNWTNYSPPDSVQIYPYNQNNFCSDWERAGMRNQNIYTSSITKGIIVGCPGNTKPLGTLGETPDGKKIPRAFVVFVKNTASVIKSFRLTIVNQPKDGRASFLEFEDLFTLDVKIAPYSSITRSVFVYSSDPKATVRIDVAEIDEPNGSLIPDGLESYVLLNPEIENPEIENPEIENPDILAAEVHNPEIENPEIINWNYDILNPEIINPEIENPEIINPEIINPEIKNPEIINPEIENPEIINPEIENPNISDPYAGQFTDVIWKLKNLGNTTSSYLFKTLSSAAREDGTLPGGIVAQLLIYRVYKNPAEYGSSSDPCGLREKQHHELILNIINPEIENPEIENPEIENPEIENPEIENATFNLEPDGEALVLLRLWKPNQTSAQSSSRFKALGMNNVNLNADDIFSTLVGYTSSTSRNTEELQQGVPTYPADSSVFMITTKFLSDGKVGQAYSDFLTAAGGTKPYAWSLDSGSLPNGLFLNSSTGEISGTPTAAGTSSFTARITDAKGEFRTQDCWITIFPAAGGYTISGRVTVSGSGLSGVVMNGLPASPVTDSSGYYTDLVGPNWSGTVTPVKTGYTFSPASRAYTNVISDQVTNYAAITLTYTITATAGTGGSILPSGAVSVNYGANQTFTITPETGYHLEEVKVDGAIQGHPAPTSYTFTNVTANHTISATFAINTCIISGFVSSDIFGNNPLANVVMSGLPGDPVTNAQGVYTATVNYGWSGTVTPTLSGYTFYPAYYNYLNVTSDLSGKNYTFLGPPKSLSFIQQPTDAAAGATITPPVRVAIMDAFGSIVTTATNNVTISLSSNPGGGTLSGTLSKAAVEGIATFDELSVDKIGAGYSLKAASESLTEAQSTPFNITAGALDHFDFDTIGTQTVNTPFTITITAKDSSDNVVTSYTGTNTLNLNMGTINPTSTGNFTSGVWTGDVTVTTAQYGTKITTISGGGKTGQSNAFDVLYPGPHSTISGSIMYNGNPVIGKQKVDFWARDENSRQSFPISPTYNSSNGTYTIPNMPTGSYGIQVYIDDAPPTGGGYFPGDYYGWTSPINVSDPPTPVSKDLVCQKIMHLTLPINNGSPIGPIPPPYDTHTSPVTFKWDAIAAASTYQVSVDLYKDSPYDFLRNISNESGITATQKTINFPVNETNEHYEFRLYAYNSNNVMVGQLINVYTNGYGWDYRFKITAGPLASFVVAAPTSGIAGTPFSVTITAKDAGGNTTTNVTGATSLTVDSGTITPTSIAESEFTDNGIWTGNVALSEAGMRTITATNSGKTGSDTIEIYQQINYAIDKNEETIPDGKDFASVYLYKMSITFRAVVKFYGSIALSNPFYGYADINDDGRPEIKVTCSPTSFEAHNISDGSLIYRGTPTVKGDTYIMTFPWRDVFPNETAWIWLETDADDGRDRMKDDGVIFVDFR
jgi:hypothetical protein